MKKALIISVIIVLAAASVWYFMKGKGGSNSAFAEHIPANSTVIVSVNLASIAQKADLKSLGEMDLIKDAMNNEDASEADRALMKSLMEDPKSSGIDFKANPTVFVQGANGNTSVGVLLKLSDAAKYEDMMKKVMKDAKSNTIGSNTYLQEEGDNTVAMWNKDMAVIYTGAKRKTVALTADSILNGEISSMKTSTVYNGLETNDDVFVLVQNSQMYGLDQSGPLSDLDFPKEAYSVIHANFENGKISIENEAIYGNKEDAERMNFQGDKLDKNLMGYVAATKPLLATQVSIDMEKLFAFLMTSQDISKSFGEIAENLSVPRKDLMNLFSGDIAIAFTDFKMVSKEVEFFGSKMTREMPDISAAMYLGIADQELFEKLMTKSGIPKVDGLYKFDFPFISFRIAETEKGIVIGLSDGDMTKLAETKQMSDGKFDNIKAYSEDERGFGYINANVSTWPEEMQAMMKKQMGEEYAMIETVSSAFDHMHSAALTDQKGKTTIYMRDASKNALTQLIEMANKLSKVVKERNAARQQAIEEMQRMMEDEGMMEEDVVYDEEEMEMAE